MQPRVSMREIARQAGVSVATVSQVLNGRKNICTPATAEKVRTVAAQLGYRVNFGYKIMHSIPTRTVAVLAAVKYGSNDEYVRNLTVDLLTEFGNRNHAAYFYTLPPDEVAAPRKVDEFLARGVENFVFIGQPFGIAIIKEMIHKAGAGMIVTSVNTGRYVWSDSVYAMEKLFLHLHKNCGDDFRFICQQDKVFTEHNYRMQALRNIFPGSSDEELKKYVFVIPNRSFTADYTLFDKLFDSAFGVTEKLLEQIPHLRGIAYMNDIEAMGGASVLLKQNRQDVKITGFNAIRAAQHFPYPISTARHNIPEMVRLLVDYSISGKDCQISVKPEVLLK